MRSAEKKIEPCLCSLYPRRLGQGTCRGLGDIAWESDITHASAESFPLKKAEAKAASGHAQGQPMQQMPPPVPPPMPDRRQQQSPVCSATDGRDLPGNRPDPTVPPPLLMSPSDLPAHTGPFCCLPVAASPSFQADNLPAGALILLRWAKGSGCQPSCVTNNVLVIPDGSQLLEWDLTAAQQAALLNLIASASGTGGRSSRLNPARSTVTTCWR